MHDVIQQTVHMVATSNSVARLAIIFCAALLVYALGLAWLVIAAVRRAHMTWSTAGHMVLLAVVAYILAKVLGHMISDPRPYIVAHTQPLIPTAHDNGFPSDHTLLAAVLTASLWWIDRRFIAAFAIGTLLVLLGRLGIDAHHTLDVVGSVVITVIAALVSRVTPFPQTWDRPLLPRGRGPRVNRSPGDTGVSGIADPTGPVRPSHTDDGVEV